MNARFYTEERECYSCRTVLAANTYGTRCEHCARVQKDRWRVAPRRLTAGAIRHQDRMQAGVSLWRETEPGELIASVGLICDNHPELRMAA